MIGKPIGKDEVNAALVVTLSGALMVLVAKGGGSLSLGRVVGAVLSNPVPKRVVAMGNGARIPNRQIAA
jgi:hypothetical protein